MKQLLGMERIAFVGSGRPFDSGTSQNIRDIRNIRDVWNIFEVEE
ncbi:MAG: hypothetical protein ACLR78_10430 [Roseburia sp.]